MLQLLEGTTALDFSSKTEPQTLHMYKTCKLKYIRSDRETERQKRQRWDRGFFLRNWLEKSGECWICSSQKGLPAWSPRKAYGIDEVQSQFREDSLTYWRSWPFLFYTACQPTWDYIMAGNLIPSEFSNLMSSYLMLTNEMNHIKYFRLLLNLKKLKNTF